MSKASKPGRTAAKTGRSPRAQGRRRAAKRTRPSAEGAARVPQRWSAAVTRGSNALDLEASVFKKSSPRAVALSLKRSAEQSRRRKAEPFRSAMSMLNFYINRAGRNLPKQRLRMLERAKAELRKAFGRE
ncbi:MAG TPA: DUF3175 domain-containing protein [Hyphomicrobiaceae bacterium]|jgi:hypothetical protein